MDMDININPATCKIVSFSSKSMPDYKFAVYFKEQGLDLQKRKLFKTRNQALSFLKSFSLKSSHETSTKLPPLSLAEMRDFIQIRNDTAKYTPAPMLELFEDYAKMENDLNAKYNENISSAIENYFKFNIFTPRDVTLPKAREIYLKALVSSKRTLYHTRHAKLFTEKFVNFFPKEKILKELKREDIYDWLNAFKAASLQRRGKPLSNTSLYNAVHYISVFLNFCSKKNFILENPVKSIFMPEVSNPEPKIYSIPEVCTILNTTAYMSIERLLLLLYFFTGIRLSELLRLEWSAIKLDQGGMFLDETVVKTNKRRFVVFPQNLLDALPPYCAKFGSVEGKIFDFNIPTVNVLLHNLFELSKVTRIRNGIRHTAASFHLARSGNAFKTAEQLGNSARILKLHYTGNVTNKQCQQFYSLDLTKPTIELSKEA